MRYSSRFLSSFTDLAQHFNQHFKSQLPLSSSYAIRTVSIFTLIMKTCKGRDKFLSLFQYLCQFSKNIRGSNKPKFQTLKKALKNSRKIFKFLKFFQEIPKIAQLRQSQKPTIFVLILCITALLSLSANIFDNILWLINIEILNYQKQLLRSIKDKLNLSKTLMKAFGMIGLKIRRIKTIKTITQCIKCMFKKNPNIKRQMIKILRKRRKNLFASVQIVQTCLRVLMLLSRLKLIRQLSSQVYNMIGMISSCLSIWKLLFEKKRWLSIQKQKRNQNDQKFDV